MSLQGIDERGQKWHEAFGANSIGSIPCSHQCLLNLWSIVAWACRWRCHLSFQCMIEQPHGIFAMIARDLGKGVQQFPFLCQRGSPILRGQLM